MRWTLARDLLGGVWFARKRRERGREGQTKEDNVVISNNKTRIKIRKGSASLGEIHLEDKK